MSFSNLFELNNKSSKNYADLKCEINDPITYPFNLQWCFGLNSRVPVINLSTLNQSIIAYACSHVVVLYDYKLQEMFTLQGHRNCVKTLSVDKTGKWLLTADFDNNCTVIIWDTKKRVPIFTLFNPHGESGITAASLSVDGKFIVTIGDEKDQLVKLWLLTSKEDYPNAVTKLTKINHERVKDVTFSYEMSKMFALTTDHHIMFITWNHTEKNLNVNCPFILKKTNLGILNNTTFVLTVTKAFTGTDNGFYTFLYIFSIFYNSFKK